MSKTKKILPELRFPEFKDCGEWEYEKGDKLFEPISNKNHNSDLPILAITQEQGAIPRERIDYHVSVTDKSIESYKVVEIGDFIISLRSFQGGIEYSNYLGLCSPAYIILRKKIDVINDFYRHYFKSFSFIKDLNKNLEGIRDGKMISYKQFSEIFIPKPSIEEQQCIAACLSSLDELISAHSQKLELLKAHKKGLMQNMFPQEGKKVPKLRFKEFEKDGEWEHPILSKVSDVIMGSSPSSTSYNEDRIGLPLLQGNADIKNRLSAPRIYTTEITKECEVGDILLSVRAPVGTVAKSIHNACIGRGISALRAKKTNSQEYLYQWLFSYESSWGKISQGGTFDAVNSDDVRNLLVPIPSPKEQQKIASCLSSLDELITAQSKKIEQLKQHKKGLMQGLFPKINE